MKHSLMRLPNEEITLFSHKVRGGTNKLKVYEFSETYGLKDITPEYTVNRLNAGYFSTKIVTPNKHCYVLIMFNYNPIVLRVGVPKLQFFYWSKRDKIYPYTHYNEFGEIVSEGNLKQLMYGFHYYTPVEETLGYVEVEENPFVISVPYKMSAAGVGINIDWRRTIIRHKFNVKTYSYDFTLNTVNNKFFIKTFKNSFNIKTKSNEFNRKTIKQIFKVSCK